MSSQSLKSTQKYQFRPCAALLKDTEIQTNPQMYVPKSWALKLGVSYHSKPLSKAEYRKWIREFKKPDVQARIVSKIKRAPPKTLIRSYRRMYGMNAQLVSKSITEFLRMKYNSYSLFNMDIGFVVGRGIWTALTDTSVREQVLEIYRTKYNGPFAHSSKK